MKPLTKDILIKMVEGPQNPLEDVRNTFMVLLMTFAMLRESETYNSGSRMFGKIVWKGVFIRRSKTDQGGMHRLSG